MLWLYFGTVLSTVTFCMQETLKAAAPGSHYATSDALAKELSDALVLAALQRGSMDNITVLVVLMQWD